MLLIALRVHKVSACSRANLSFQCMGTMTLCFSLQGPFGRPGPRSIDDRMAQTLKNEGERERERERERETAGLADCPACWAARSKLCLRNVMLRQTTEAKAGFGAVSGRARCGGCEVSGGLWSLWPGQQQSKPYLTKFSVHGRFLTCRFISCGDNWYESAIRHVRHEVNLI